MFLRKIFTALNVGGIHGTSDYELLDLDYLVFSSHKTATQTLTYSLKRSGFKCRHCHQLPHIDLKEGDFQNYLDKYFKKNRKKLNVITVFRDPLPRHISSFFQFYGSRPLDRDEVSNKYETIIYRYSIEQLCEKFASELSDKTSLGFLESIYDICSELNIEVSELTYNQARQIGVYETDLMRLHVLRFDLLVNNMKLFMREITGTNIRVKTANMTQNKWYKRIYANFKTSLALPEETILKVYHAKRDLIDLTYPDHFNELVNQACLKYGRN